jgi:hypothetical protein
MKIKPGSIWSAGDGKEFVVLSVTEIDDHVWVHYRDQACREYSCYLESFVNRFSELTNQGGHHGS